MNTLPELLTSHVALQELISRVLPKPFSRDLLKLDCAAEVERICALIQQEVLHNFHKKGVVLGLSGGIDSSAVTIKSSTRLSSRGRAVGLPSSVIWVIKNTASVTIPTVSAK